MHPDYLEKILNARVYDVAIESPLELAPNLSARSGNRIWLKREDMQPVFSFKLRGAYNKMAQLDPDARAAGVIAASAGNHAQGVALAARNKDLAAAMAKAMNDMKADGSFQKLFDQYGVKSVDGAVSVKGPAG